MKRIVIILVLAFSSLLSFGQERILMKKEGGVYTIPCTANGLRLRFIFDTGAADVSISITEASFMYKNDYITDSDIVDSKNYVLADGSIVENAIINIKELKVGSKTLYNVKAAVSKNENAPLLLGQSAIKQLSPWYFDGDCLVFGTQPNSIECELDALDYPIEDCLVEAKKQESLGNLRFAKALFIRACENHNFASYNELALFAERHSSDNEYWSAISPSKVYEAAFAGYQPMLNFLKKYPQIMTDTNDILLSRQYYSALVNKGYYFLCRQLYEIYTKYDPKLYSEGLKQLELGSTHSQTNCMGLYGCSFSPLYDFVGSTKDTNKAVYWLRLAAKAGNKGAPFYLAEELYSRNSLSTAEQTEMLSNYKLAAANGYEEATYSLAYIYLFGKFAISPNVPLAIEYSNKMTETKRYKTLGYTYLGMCYQEKGDFKGAFPYFEKAYYNAVSNGEEIDDNLNFSLGEYYYLGDACPVDYRKAFLCLSNVREDTAFYPLASRYLGKMYENGVGTTKDLRKAVYYYKIAAENGNLECQYALGSAYFFGNGVATDESLAFNWMHKAADNGYAFAYYALGIFYRSDYCSRYSPETAIAMFKKAAENKIPAAYYELGMIYEEGLLGVSKSFNTAKTYFEKGAALGDEQSKEKLKAYN